MVCFYCMINGHTYQYCPVVIYRIYCKKNNVKSTRWYDDESFKTTLLPPSNEPVPKLFCEICADTDHIMCNCPLMKRYYNSRNTSHRMPEDELYKYA